MRKTTVTLRPIPTTGLVGVTALVIGPGAGGPGTYATTSDAEGKFHFERIPPGRYQLSAEHTGYLRTSYGAKPNEPLVILTLTAGKTPSDLIFNMIPAAIISGKVLDEDGDPMAQVTVRPMQMVYRNGKKTLQMMGLRQTDSNGEFKFDTLAAGKYYLSANKRGMTSFPSENVANANLKPGQQEEDYVTTYYPGVTEQSAAQAITVTVGQELSGGINRGNINADGTFDMGAFAPGSYVAQVTTSSGMIQALAKRRVELGHQDKNDVVLTLQPLAEVSGVVELQPDPKPSQPRPKPKRKART